MSAELKAPELKPTIISEMRRKDKVGAQVKPSALVNRWIIRAEAQDLRAKTQDLTDENPAPRVKRFGSNKTQKKAKAQIRTEARDLRAKAHDLSGLKPRTPELKSGSLLVALGPSWAPLGASWAPPGGLLGPPEAAGGFLGGRAGGGLAGLFGGF